MIKISNNKLTNNDLVFCEICYRDVFRNKRELFSELFFMGRLLSRV